MAGKSLGVPDGCLAECTAANHMVLLPDQWLPEGEEQPFNLWSLVLAQGKGTFRARFQTSSS